MVHRRWLWQFRANSLQSPSLKRSSCTLALNNKARTETHAPPRSQVSADVRQPNAAALIGLTREGKGGVQPRDPAHGDARAETVHFVRTRYAGVIRMARAVSHAGFTTISLRLAAAEAAAAVARGTPSTGPRSRLWVEEELLAAPLAAPPPLLPVEGLPSTPRGSRLPFSRGLLAALARGGN